MKGEFDALRKVARLAFEYVEIETLEPPDGAALTAALEELVIVLDDLWLRFPYSIETASSVSARLLLQARLAGQAPGAHRLAERADSE